MDPTKWKVLADLVREARKEDARTFKAMEAANSDWKAANAVLTDRIKMLDGYIADAKNQDTAL